MQARNDQDMKHAEQARVTKHEAKVPLRGEVDITIVDMEDGRKVEFRGAKRNLLKSYSTEGGKVTAQFDFRNGKSFTLNVPDSLLLQFAGHGALQKVGDEASGESLEDAVIAIESVIDRLSKGNWGVERSAGGSFSGSSLVILALMEVTGLTYAAVKKNLDDKLAATEGLTRQALYASFKNPALPTAAVIARMEAEKAAKSDKNATKVDAGEFLAGMMG